MSNVIEQQILEMRFDNKQFEDNVAESINTLGKLKENLKFDGVEKNFDALSNASNGIDFSPLNDKLTGLGEHISQVFREIGVGALREFGASMERDVVNKIKDLTFGQFTEGWGKYNEKVQSVQTIMAATGLTINEVSEQLDRLNWFSDETSYSFTDMTSNVAKFTGAGVKLEEAVTAMQGISTWAALAGQDSAGAARAMYNLSQAMGMGYVSLNDWKSIENVNMSMDSFKRVLMDTAASMGTLIKYSDGTYQAIKADGKAIDVTVEGMRESLSAKWLTKDVLMETLNAYGNFANELASVCNDIGISATDFMTAIGQYDGTIESVKQICEETGIVAEDLVPHLDKLSGKEYELGRQAFAAAQEAKTLKDSLDATKDAVSTQWMNTFEYLFGNYEQAKEFFTKVTNTLWDMFATSGEIRNTILEQWSEVGGEIFRSGILNTLEGISNIVDFIRSIITETLGITGLAVDENGKTIEATSVFAEKLLDATKSFGKWAREFAEITADLSNIVSTDDTLFIVLYEAFELFGRALETVWNIVKSLAPLFKDLLVLFRSVYEFIGRYAIMNLINLADTLLDLINEHQIFEKVIGGVTAVLKPFIDAIISGISWLHSFLYEVENIVRESQIFQNIYEGLKILFDPLIQKIKTFYNVLKDIEIPNIFGFVKEIDTKPFYEFSEKIVPFFESLRDKLASSMSIFDKAGSVFGMITEKIRGFIELAKEKIDLSQFSSLDEILGKIKEKLEPVWTFLNNIFTSLKEFDFGTTFQTISEFLSNIASTVWNTLSGLDFKKMGENIVETFKNAATNIGNIFKNLDFGEILQNAGNNLSKIFSEFNLSNIFEYLTKFSVLFGGFNLGKLAGSLSDTLSGGEGGFFGSLSTGLTDIFGGLKDTLSSFTAGTDDSKLMSIAKAIGIFTVALLFLGTVNSDNIADILLGIGAAFGGTFLASKGASFLDDQTIKNIKGAGLGLLEVAAAIWILVDALEPLAEMNGGQLAKLGGALTVILLEISLFINNFTKQNAEHDAKNAQKAAFALIEIAAAVAIMVGALKDIAKLNGTDYAQGIFALTAIMAEVGIFERMMSKQDTDGLTKVGTTAILLGVAMNELAIAFRILASGDWNKWMQSFLGFTGIMLEVLLFERMMAESKTDGLVKAGTSAVLLGKAMNSFAKAFNKLASGNWERWMQSMIAFTAIMVEVGVFEAVLSRLNPDNMLKVSAAIVVLAAGLDLLIPALMAFSVLPWKSFGYFSALMGSMLAFGAIAGFLAPISTGLFAIGTALLEIGAGVALVGAGIALIGFGLVEIASALVLINLAGIIGSIAKIGSGLAGLINQLDVKLMIENMKLFFNALPGIITGFVVGMIESFKTYLNVAKDFLLTLIDMFTELVPEIAASLTSLIVESLASLSDSLGMIIPTLMDILIQLLDGLIEYLPPIIDKLAKIICIIFDKLTEHIPEMLTSFMNFVGALFGELLKVVEGTDQQTLLKIAEMFAGLVIIIEVLNLIKSAIPGAMAGLAEISLFVAELALIIAAFGALNSIPGFQWLVEKGGDLLEAVGTAIGKFIGGIVGGLLEGATSTLPQVGTNIANFWNNIKPFIEGVSEVSAETVAKVGFLSACVTALTAADFIGGISDFMRDKLNVQEFGMSIQKMWHNIKPFIEGVEVLDNKTVSSVESLSKAILTLTAAQLIEGVRSFVFGKADVDKFGESIGSLGPHLAKFSDSVKDIDTAAVEVASKAIALLADTFSNDAFKTGGVVQWFSGEMTDLEKFGKGLVALGPMIKQYAASVAGLDNNVIQNSTIGAGALAEMAKKLPRKGGIVGELRGDSDLVDFATGLAVLGPQLKIYAMSVKGLDTDVVTNSINAATAISELATKLPEKSIMDRIFGKDAMLEFAQNLDTFGTALKEYYDNIAGIEYEQMTAMIKATEELFTLFSGESGVTFKIDKDFKKAMKDIANSGITEFVTTLASSVETITTAGTEFISNFASGVDETAHVVRESFDGMIQYCLDKVTNSLSQYRKAGRNLIENFALGISDTTKIVKASVNTILTALYDQVTAETLKASFRKAGEDLMAKYAAGILSQVVLVAATASVVSAASLEQFNGEAVMTAYYNAGSGVMSEYVRGMESQAPYVKRAAATIASSARSSVEGELQQLKNDINNWINNNVNFNPVITPTIDTSDLEAALRDLREEYADVLNSDATSSSANSIISGYQAGVYPASHYQTIYDTSTGANIYVNANYNVNGSYDLDRANAELARRLERLYS